MWDAVLFFALAAICLAIFLLRWDQLSAAMKWVGVAHGINTLSLATGQLMTLNGVENNLFIFHFSIILLYAAYAMAFYCALKNPRQRRLIIWSIGVFTGTSLLLTATIQPVSEFNSYARSLSNVLLTTWSLTYLYTLFAEVKTAHLEQNSFFWVSTGLLFTSLGSFFVYGLMSYLIRRSMQEAQNVYVLIDALRFLLIVVFIIAVYADRLFARKGQPQ